jgi:hypothetical protein
MCTGSACSYYTSISHAACLRSYTTTCSCDGTEMAKEFYSIKSDTDSDELVSLRITFVPYYVQVSTSLPVNV